MERLVLDTLKDMIKATSKAIKDNATPELVDSFLNLMKMYIERKGLPTKLQMDRLEEAVTRIESRLEKLEVKELKRKENEEPRLLNLGRRMG